MLSYLHLFLTWIAHSDRVGITAMRIAIAIVFLWIGGLKFARYEADSITPFVANSPLMSFFYKHPTEYKAHLTREGELNPADRSWQTANDTYAFSRGLGLVEVAIGLLALSGLVSDAWGLLGATLAFLTSFVTPSFLVTTPEAWVPALGDAEHGFSTCRAQEGSYSRISSCWLADCLSWRTAPALCWQPEHPRPHREAE